MSKDTFFGDEVSKFTNEYRGSLPRLKWTREAIHVRTYVVHGSLIWTQNLSAPIGPSSVGSTKQIQRALYHMDYAKIFSPCVQIRKCCTFTSELFTALAAGAVRVHQEVTPPSLQGCHCALDLSPQVAVAPLCILNGWTSVPPLIDFTHFLFSCNIAVFRVSPDWSLFSRFELHCLSLHPDVTLLVTRSVIRSPQFSFSP